MFLEQLRDSGLPSEILMSSLLYLYISFFNLGAESLKVLEFLIPKKYLDEERGEGGGVK